MGNGIQFLDIIFFAMIAVFLVLRLRGVLGRRDEDEDGRKDIFDRGRGDDPAEDNIIQLPERNDPLASDPEDDDFESAGGEVDELTRGFREIQTKDPTFDRSEFLVGARVAFEMVLNAYASGDTDTLKQLLNNDVYANFAKVIQDRERAGHVMEDTLVGIRTADIIEAFIEGRFVNITVKFVTDQINITRDENGDVVDGNPNAVIKVTDFWTFARESNSRDPNWELVATRSLD